MKKNIIIATVAAAAALFISSSCAKQDIDVQTVSGAKVFTASIEQGLTKTTLINDKNVGWNEEDLININGQEFSAVPNTKDATKATFTLSKGTTPNPPYEAIYPAELYNKNGFIFPQTQYYEKGRFNAPMYAQGDEENLEFKNICGVIRLSLKLKEGEEEDRVRRIKIYYEGDVSNFLWGPFNVNNGNAVIDKDKAPHPYMGMTEEENPFITILDCGEYGVAIDDEGYTDFFIYLPPIPSNESNVLRFKVYNTDGEEAPSIDLSQGGFSIERNTLYPLNVGDVYFMSNSTEQGEAQEEAQPAIGQCAKPDDALSDRVFTVGEGPADKVYFSKGNLVATCVGSAFEFGFAEHQYAFIGNDSGNANLFNNVTLAENQKIDLFCWSRENNIYGISKDGYYNSFTDWGNAVTPSDTWRTLTGGDYGEWKYLLNTRTVNGGTGENYSYKLVDNYEVGGNNFSGLFIFPDDFTDQNDFADKYTTWAEIDGAGIVFLPTAGWGFFNGTVTTFIEAGLAYWSSTGLYGILCNSNGRDFAHSINSEYSRHAVRLVANAFEVVADPGNQEVIIAE